MWDHLRNWCLLSALPLGCDAPSPMKPPDDPVECVPSFQGSTFVPHGEIGEHFLGQLRGRWHEWILLGTGEIPLTSGLNPDIDEIRLTWDPAFATPIVVRLSRYQSEVKMVAKFLSWSPDKGRYVFMESHGDLSLENWAIVADGLAGAGFWDAPCVLANDMAIDGEVFYLEVLDASGYHCMFRHAVWEFPEFLEVGECMLSWAGYSDIPYSYNSLYTGPPLVADCCGSTPMQMECDTRGIVR